MDIKQLKKEIKAIAAKQPEKFFPVETLKEHDFKRQSCKCGRYFWSINDAEVCGDCEGYTFIGKKIAKQKISFLEVAERFAKVLKKLGYEPTKRYPIVARWRDDIPFVMAGINNYQPYVVSGEVEPPANPLTVAQPSLRFNDVDNVGITGRHYVGHVHLEQFAVFPPEKFDQPKYLRDLLTWIKDGLTIPLEEIKLHEDAWGGGGNLGTSLEHFCHGVELGNQVYMSYKTTETGYEPLKVKVLDMGAGQERYSWITGGELCSYEAVMPDICKKLYDITAITPDKQLLEKFVPYSGSLNVDEVDDINKQWKWIADKIGINVEKLKQEVLPVSQIYVIADHSRALLFALADGGLPSNSGGGYNLRSIYRRIYDIISNHKWDVSIPELCEWHAKELKPQYPEYVNEIEDVKNILEAEELKYKDSRVKAREIIAKLKQSKQELNIDKLVELYDSHGISPTLLVDEKVISSQPADFYMKLADKHEKTAQVKPEKVYFELSAIPPTQVLWYDPVYEFDAKVLSSFEDKGNNYVVLDKTAFYPTSGGQACDLGTIDGVKVLNVQKQGHHAIHQVEKKIDSGKTVKGKVDKARRMKLTRIHSATHLINGAARKVLGNHIWQAGAEKTIEKGRLDVTHYANITTEQLQEIQDLANECIRKAIFVDKTVMDRTKAELKYGFRLYQGGAVPGKSIRVVSISGIDVEACGGTHVNNTKEIEEILIIKSQKIQDGVIRIEFVAGTELVENTMKKLETQEGSELQKWVKEIEKLDEERVKLGAKQMFVGKFEDNVEALIKKWKEVKKDLEKLQKQKATAGTVEPVQLLETADMKLLQNTASEILKKNDYAVLIAPGMVFGVDKKSGRPVQKAVEEAAKIMGGKAGGKNGEWKGGGPLVDKARTAFEKVKEILLHGSM